VALRVLGALMPVRVASSNEGMLVVPRRGLGRAVRSAQHWGHTFKELAPRLLQRVESVT
jgi:hypothetical protein